MARHCDVAIIGAGTAGLKAYRAANALGAEVLLIERGSGGTTCTRTGCMPSKALLAAANAAFAVAHAGQSGVNALPPRIDGPEVMRRVRAQRDHFVASVLEEYEAIPAAHRVHGTARFVGHDRLSVDGDTIAASAIIIATGALPSIPDSLDSVRALVRTHETIFDIDTLPARLAVLGAGPVGIELAQAFARLGTVVTLFDPDHVLGGMSDPVANDAARQALEKEVTLHLGVEVTAEPDGDGARLSWPGGSATVDLILAAAGRPPNLAPLELAASGLALDEHGVPLFDHRTRRCGESSIFIAGDAGAWRPVLHEAARGGEAAGRVAAGGEPPRALPRFAVAFTEPNLVEVGTACDALPGGARIGESAMADNGRATIERRREGIVRLYGDAEGRLIGASIVAHGGEHLGHLVALAIDRGMTAAEFADQPWYHPTLEEALQQAARALAGITD